MFIVYKDRFNIVEAFELADKDYKNQSEKMIFFFDTRDKVPKKFKIENILSEHNTFEEAEKEAKIKQKDYKILKKPASESKETNKKRNYINNTNYKNNNGNLEDHNTGSVYKKLEKIFMVYKNRYNEVKPYEIEILSISDDRIKANDIKMGKEKSFILSSIISINESYVEAKENAEKKQKKYTLKPRPENKPKLEKRKVESLNIDNKLLGKKVVFTGTFEEPRKNLEFIAESVLSANVSGSISSKTDYLICGEKPGSKLKKAQVLGVEVLSEEDISYIIKDTMSKA